MLRDLIEQETFDVDLDLNPDKRVVGHVEGVCVAGVFPAGEYLRNVLVVDEENESEGRKHNGRQSAPMVPSCAED